MFESVRNLSPESLTNAGLLVSFAALFLYVIGPTFVDPYGDGLWYGVSRLLAEF
jgi:hypothetical protein